MTKFINCEPQAYTTDLITDVCKINSGSFGTIYRANLTRPDNVKVPVAIKSLSKLFFIDTKLLDRPFAEKTAFTILGDCEHFVRLYFTFQDDLFLYFLMDFVDGQTLETLITSFEVSCDQFLKITQQLFLAVNVLHAKGIIHRDLHPGNIIISNGPRNVLKILDYGECITINCLQSTPPKLLKRVNGYARAPEIQTGVYSYSVDYWSVGVSLYELCELKPFDLTAYLSNCLQFNNSKHVNLLRGLLCIDPSLRYQNFYNSFKSFSFDNEIFNIKNFKQINSDSSIERNVNGKYCGASFALKIKYNSKLLNDNDYTNLNNHNFINF